MSERVSIEGQSLVQRYLRGIEGRQNREYDAQDLAALVLAHVEWDGEPYAPSVPDDETLKLMHTIAKRILAE